MAKEQKEPPEENIRRILKPLVRMCLRNSISIQPLITLLKSAYVEVTVEELSRAGKKVNMSRFNVMTGVQRADIALLYKKKEPLKPIIGDIVKRVIGQWSNDRRFTTKDGKPRVISFAGRDSEFERLVQLVTTSVGPKAVLFDLERIGAVQQTTSGLKLVATTVKHGKDRVQAGKLLSKNIETLIQTTHENGLSESEEVPHLHIRTEYDNVFVKDLPKIREWLKREGRKFHKRARDFISRYDQDISDNPGGTAGGRVILGAFSLTSHETELSDITPEEIDSD